MKKAEGEVPLPHMSDANICEPSVMYWGGEFGLVSESNMQETAKRERDIAYLMLFAVNY